MKYICKTGKHLTAAGILMVLSLISLPGNLLHGQISQVQGKVNSIVVDHENTKWFSTDAGIVSYDGNNWILHDQDDHLPKQHVRSLTISADPEGPALWIASPQGVTVTRLPISEQTEVITYSSENAPISSNDVLGVAAGGNAICWIGTARGVSALSKDSWLTPDYDMHYPESVFTLFPITSMATNLQGDSLYVGTSGGGVARIYRDNLDGISGASVYAQWGPIDLPSDHILSIYIEPDGTKWFGTTEGIARHTGDNTLDNWTVFTTGDGLINNFVQAICGDKNGNIWFGTKAGISVFDGSTWISYTKENGLAGNNILSMATDKNGCIWIGTDTGISSFYQGKFINY